MILKKAWKHFCLITHHKWVVLKLCCKVGQPWRGLVHDMSKYSPTEFFESIKYYVGTNSPITEAKKTNGYSKAWLHHKGRNKHHSEYWYDKSAPNSNPIMPYPYVAEMLCDKMAAGIIYKKKNWTKEYQLSYWEKEKNEIHINEKVSKFITVILQQVAKDGIDKVFTSENFKQNYKKYCN